MKYYVSYLLNRKNAKPHRFNHGFGNYNKEAYNSIDEIKKDILSMYNGYHTSCKMARKVKMYIIKDTHGEFVGVVKLEKMNGRYFLNCEGDV